MTRGFEYFPHGNPRPGERLERNTNGDTLKKYGGTGTSWPTHTKVQTYGQSHKDQQRAQEQVQQNINDFFRNNF